jgi:glycosyltransferase involved in cell wall biosynthesis
MKNRGMRFHVVGLPHTQVTSEFTSCAFTEKVRRFCKMMYDLGHEVYLYAGEQSEALTDEHVVCITEQERAEAVGDKHYTQATFDTKAPHWQKFNRNVILEMRERIEPKDFICLIGGTAHREIAEAFPNHISVEFGVGYGSTFAKYKVFESYAWMHSIYAGYKNPTQVDGNFFDSVISGGLEPEAFPEGKGDGGYYLFVGRLIDRKGYAIAQQICEKLGKRLILAGAGEQHGYGEFVGAVGPEERARLMGGAIATFAPTLYIEPYGYVVIEAQMCGTPTITTDWGGFVENNVHGLTGYRCRTLQDFADAVENAKTLDRQKIRAHALANYSLDVVGKAYERYFERLMTLWGDGWYTLAEASKHEKVEQ